jgi:Rod binding domain-containing protein
MPGFRMTPTVDAALLTTAAPPAGKTPSKLADAARQFESLLIGEMLKSARESDSDGWLGSGSDSGSQSAMGLAETQFAQAISSQGGFGLAKTIERSVASQSAQKEKAAPETASTGSLQ